MVEEVEPTKTNLTPSCLHATAFNIRQYVFNNATEMDNGTLFTTTYVKSAVETGLKITFSGTTRITGTCGGASECCGYWQFLINGSPCSNPGPIMAKTMETTSTLAYYFSTLFSGVCYNVPSGPVQLALVLGTCSGYTTTADLHTGSSQTTHILVEEIRENTTFVSAKATPVFNLRNYYLNVSTDADSGLLATVRYVKTRSDTALRVTWIAYLRVSSVARNEWHIMFNGAECADPGLINFSTYYSPPGYAWSILRTGRNFGICRGIAAGNVDVSLNAVFPAYASDTMANIMTTGGVTVTIEEVLLT